MYIVIELMKQVLEGGKIIQRLLMRSVKIQSKMKAVMWVEVEILQTSIVTITLTIPMI